MSVLDGGRISIDDPGGTEGDSVGMVEIRVLGSLRVRGRDGTVIPIEAWKTRKTRDLLRLLALRAGELVPAEQVVDELWSDVPPDKGRASLRTAAFNIRRLLGPAHLVREADALTLRGAWVDAVALQALAGAAQQLFRGRELGRGLAVARQAAALYGGELAADEPYAEWAVLDRERLQLLYGTLLLEAAGAACNLGCYSEAVGLARECLEVGRATEGAYRALMRSYWGLGESRNALRAYEQCRSSLVEELGADPSPETEALHLRILRREEAPSDASIPFIGRQDELQTVLRILEQAAARGEPLFVLLTAPPRCGASALLEQVSLRWSAGTLRVEPGQEPPGYNPAGELVVVDELHRDPALLRWLASSVLAGVGGPVLATVDQGALGANGRAEPLIAQLRARGLAVVVELAPLERSGVASLAEAITGVPPAPELIELLHAASHGRPDAAAAHLRKALARGQVVFTESGAHPVELALAQDERGIDRAEGVRTALGASCEEALDVVSVLSEPFALTAVGSVIGDDARAADALDALEDLGVLVRHRERYRFADARLRAALYAWLRPSRRRQLHLAVAARASLAPDLRIHHLLEGGSPEQAHAVASTAGRVAFASGQLAQARVWLQRADELAGAAPPAERLRDLELLASCCYDLAVFRQAVEALKQAELVAAVAGAPQPARLHHLRAAVALAMEAAEDAVRGCDKALELNQGVQDLGSEALVRTTRGAALALSAPRRAQYELRQAAELAALADVPPVRALSRAELAGSSLYVERRFVEAATCAAEAVAVAEDTGDDAVLARVLRTVNEPVALLGGTKEVIADLERASRAAERANLVRLRDELTPLLCGVAHALGSRRFHDLWGQRATAGTPDAAAYPSWGWVAVRVLHERGRLGEAYSAVWQHEDPSRSFVRQAPFALAAARLFAELGHHDLARRHLECVVRQGMETGAVLLVPEAAARLALLHLPGDPPAAHRQLATARDLVNDGGHVRERSAILLAHAAFLAHTRGAEAGLEVAAAAVEEAASGGQVFAQGEALEHLGGHARRAGARAIATRAWQDAAELYEAVGAPERANRCLPVLGQLEDLPS